MQPDDTRDNARESTASPLDEALGHALAIGIVAVLLIPAARGFSETLGWLPLWLLVMPLTALAARRGAASQGAKKLGRRRKRVGA